MSKQIKVLVADDHPFFRQGIIAELKKDKDISIVFEAKNGIEVLDWLKEYMDVDVLLLDIDMPIMSGLDVLKEIRSGSHQVRTIIVSMLKADDIIQDIIEAGAQGFVCKDEEPGEIYKAIHGVMKNGIYFSESTNSALMHSMLRKSQSASSVPTTARFTQREVRIIQLISQERTNEEIAKELNLGLRTIEGIRQELIHRAGAKNAIGLIIYAQKNNLLNSQ